MLQHPLPPRRLRRGTVLAVGLACLGAVLAGCGGSSGDGGSASSAVKRTVEHVRGTSAVPVDPQRVVVLDTPLLDSAIALGVVPIAAAEGLSGGGLGDYLGEDVADIKIVGTVSEPNTEEILALQPDLIIGTEVRHAALYDQLSQLAPTVFAKDSGTNWPEQVETVGKALGKEAEAAELLADYRTRAKQVGEQIGASGLTARIVRFMPDEIRLYGPGTFSGSVLTEVGIDLTGPSYDAQYSMAQLSPERIDELSTDLVFATNPEEESEGKVATARPSVGPLWDALPAVQNGKQFDIKERVWMLGIGVIGANLILDDLEAWVG